MFADDLENKECLDDAESTSHLYDEIPPVVKELASSCREQGCFDHLGAIPIPTHATIVQIIDQSRRILFPGYFSSVSINPANLEYCIGQETTELFENLAGQIIQAIASREELDRAAKAGRLGDRVIDHAPDLDDVLALIDARLARTPGSVALALRCARGVSSEGRDRHHPG